VAPPELVAGFESLVAEHSGRGQRDGHRGWTEYQFRVNHPYRGPQMLDPGGLVPRRSRRRGDRARHRAEEQDREERRQISLVVRRNHHDPVGGSDAVCGQGARANPDVVSQHGSRQGGEVLAAVEEIDLPAILRQ
jgi:hypothetical protein